MLTITIDRDLTDDEKEMIKEIIESSEESKNKDQDKNLEIGFF